MTQILEQNSEFFQVFYKSNNMFKRSVSPNELRNEPVEQNEATNIGLINVSSSSISDLSPLEIIEIVGFAILCILFCRWVWKFYTKQRAKKQVRGRTVAQRQSKVAKKPQK